MSNKKSVKEQVQEKYKDFVSEVDILQVPELKARIVVYQQQLQESNEHKENNEQLTNARALVTELAGPYNDVSKAVKLKTKYIIDLIKEKGS